MDRRSFMGAIAGGLLAAPLAAEAQQAGKMPRIGYLAAALAANPHFPEGFRQGLRDLGYIEGHSIVIECRDAPGKAEQLPDLAAELVGLPTPDSAADPLRPAGLRARRGGSTW